MLMSFTILPLREPIYTMTIINKHVFVTGDDDGTVKCNKHTLCFS